MVRFTFLIMALSALVIAPTETFAQPRRGADRRPPGRTNLLMRLFDSDQDGALSPIEITDAAARLKEFDQNNDGKLSAEELRGALPLGRRPGGSGGGRPSLGSEGRGGVAASDLEKETLAQDHAEERILATLKKMLQGERFRNVSPTDGRLLRLLAEAVDAKRVVEIGTSTGESAVWLALAVESTRGHVYTHEIDENRARIAGKNFKMAGVDELITLVPGDAHETVERYQDPNDPLYIDTKQRQSIDILFLDADKDGYIDYLEKLMPLIRPGGLIIAHNMNTRMADSQFVKAITENPQLETLILLKEGTGVSVTIKKRK